jgi:hypothetical protein
VSLGSRRATRPVTRVALQNTSRVLLLAIAAVAGPEVAAAQPDTEAGAPPVIIRGSSSAESGDVVLRGTPPPVPLPPPIYTCAPGYLPDPRLGCTVPGVAYPPNDLGYWPFPWFYDFSLNARPHRFRRGFTRFAHRDFRRR